MYNGKQGQRGKKSLKIYTFSKKHNFYLTESFLKRYDEHKSLLNYAMRPNRS